MEQQKFRPTCIIGPDGKSLSLDRLPSPSTKRWMARKKAEVVAAVEGGLLTLDEALSRYSLSLEEFAAWQRWAERAGIPALRATKSQQYRAEWEQRGG
jgi:hypothetical protein